MAFFRDCAKIVKILLGTTLWLSIKLMENLHSSKLSWHWKSCTKLQCHHVRQTTLFYHPWKSTIKSWLPVVGEWRRVSDWNGKFFRGCSEILPQHFIYGELLKLRMNQFLMDGFAAAAAAFISLHYSLFHFRWRLSGFTFENFHDVTFIWSCHCAKLARLFSFRRLSILCTIDCRRLM